MGYEFDGPNKKIRLTIGTTAVEVDDMYSRWVDWFLTSDNSKFLPAIRNVGGDSISATKDLGLTFFLLNGWRIVPQDADHRLTLNGNLYTDPSGYSPIDSVPGRSIIVEYAVSNLVDSSLAQMEEIEYASFNGGVTIDAVNGVDSSVYPVGTPMHPCKTPANSYAIRMQRGFNKIYLLSDLTLAGIPDGVLSDLVLEGILGFRQLTITFDNVLVSSCVGKNLNVTGTLKPGSSAVAYNCNIFDIANVDLQANDSTIFGGTYEATELRKCTASGDIKVKEDGRLSGVNIVFEGDYTTIDMQSAPCTVSLDVDSGYFKLLNSVEGCLAEFNLRGGEIEIDESCTGGDFYAEGYGTLYGDPEAYGMSIKANHLLALETIPIPILESSIDGEQIQGSLAAALRDLRERHAGRRVVADRGANIIRVYGENGGDLLYTITRTTDGNVDTYARS
jgi:hypothetical protein